MENKNAGLEQTILQECDQAVTWDINYKTSHVRFLVTQRNLVARPFRKIEGNFKNYSAIVQTITDDFTDGVIDFSIIADSINTGNTKRDKHLASTDFFDAAKFPVIKFHGVSLEKEKNNNYILEGDCSIRGLNQRLLFDVTYEGTKENEWGDRIAVFKASTRVNRRDFGFKFNPLIEAFIGKEVAILINLELARKSRNHEVKEKLKSGMNVY
jgi:polyisoprenoid-binding protein YceI